MVDVDVVMYLKKIIGCVSVCGFFGESERKREKEESESVCYDDVSFRRLHVECDNKGQCKDVTMVTYVWCSTRRRVVVGANSKQKNQNQPPNRIRHPHPPWHFPSFSTPTTHPHTYSSTNDYYLFVEPLS